MRLPTPTALRFLAALLLLPLAACDETAGLDDPVDLVVDDAVAAREAGDLDAAEALLRRALDRAPQDATVRVELATTLLQREGLDLLDLDRVAQFLDDGAASAAPAAARGGCVAPADAERFEPSDVPGFDAILAAAATLAEADGLLDTVVPAALQSFDLCTSVQDGALVYDRAGALAALAAAGLSADRAAQALAVNAAVQFLDAYATVATALPDDAAWYRDGDGRITICVSDDAALRAAGEDAVRDLGEAAFSLDARAALLDDGGVADEIVGAALEAFEEVRDAVADFCSTS